MEIRQIYYVLEIAKQKSFSGAAKALFITQPAISQQVSSLENELQIKLFQRDTHKVILTKEGERFCEYGKKVLEAVDNLTEAFGQGRSDQKMILNIGVFPFYRIAGLARALTFFFSTNPNVLGSMKVVENYKAFEKLKNEVLDFAIIKAIPETIPGYISYDILQEENLCAVMSSKNEYAVKEYIDIQDLGKLPLSTGERNSHLYDYMKNLYESNGLNFNVAFFNTNEAELMLEMMASGTGILLATQSIAEKISGKNAKACVIIPRQKLCTVLAYKKECKLKGLQIAFRNHILHYYQTLQSEEEENLVMQVEGSTADFTEKTDFK